MAPLQKKLKIGQVVRFKNYRRNESEKEAYFIVIQENNERQEMVLCTINSNRIYKTGITIIPKHPEEDLLLVVFRRSELIQQQLTFKENKFSEVAIGTSVYFFGDNKLILFKQIGTTLVSDAVFEFYSGSENRLMGHLYIEMNYENNNQ